MTQSARSPPINPPPWLKPGRWRFCRRMRHGAERHAASGTLAGFSGGSACPQTSARTPCWVADLDSPGRSSSCRATEGCVVPEGTAIFVSALGVVCSTVEGPVEGTRFFGQSEDELRACTARELDESTDGNQQYRVNGQEVADLDTYRTASPLFTVTLPENNIFGVEPGVAQAVSESYSFIIAPPSPGRIPDHLLNVGLRGTRGHRQRHRRSTPSDRAADDDLTRRHHDSRLTASLGGVIGGRHRPAPHRTE